MTYLKQNLPLAASTCVKISTITVLLRSENFFFSGMELVTVGAANPRISLQLDVILSTVGGFVF